MAERRTTSTTSEPRGSVARNVLALVGARVAVALAGLVTLPVVFHHLGPREFGVWVVLSGLATVVAMADLGLGSAIVRQVAGSIHDGDLRRSRIALGIGLVWGVTLAAAGAALLLLCWPALVALLNLGAASAEAARLATLVLLLGVLADGVSLPWRGVLEGHQWYSALAWITAGTGALGAGLSVVAVETGGGLGRLAGSVALAAVVRACLVLALAHRCAPAMTPGMTGLTRADLRSIGGYGVRVQVTSASGALNVELDRFVLTGFFGPAVAGGFDLGGRLVNLGRTVPALALVALFPLAVRRTGELGTAWLDGFHLTVTKYLAAGAAVGAALLVVTAEPLVRLWLGQANHFAALNVMVLAPAYAINLATGATCILGRVEGMPGRETAYAVLSVAINLALTWPLLHVLGPVGVPLASAIGITLGTAYFLHSYHRVTRRRLLPLLRVMWPSVVAACAAVLVGVLAADVLPDGAGRLGAGVAVALRSVVVLLVAGLVLAGTGLIGTHEVAEVRRFLRLRNAPAEPPLAGAAVTS